jgi:hypothetical protein
MQHIKTYMAKIDDMIKNGTPKKSKKETDVSGVSDKNVRIIANFVKGIREAREGMLNGK